MKCSQCNAYIKNKADRIRHMMIVHGIQILAIALMFLLASCTHLHKLMGDATPVKGESTPIFLLAGQSNMVRMSQYGLEAFTAEYVKRHGGPDPEFVACAVGGTDADQWLPHGQLFANCIVAARGKTITGVLYYQGESDAALAVPDWGDSFAQTVGGFRQYFGNVPIVFAQIARTVPGCNFDRGWTSIQAQQAAVSLPGVTMIRTEDVAVLIDTVHLAPSSLQIIAQRFADNIGGHHGKN